MLIKRFLQVPNKSMKEASHSLFNYLSYRDFLRDFYTNQKSHSPWYSYRVFAQQAGLASPNYLKLVIDGQRRITDKTLDAFIKGLKLDILESNYFKTLVLYNNNKNDKTKNKYLDELLALKRSATKAAELRRDRYDILGRWHHWIIREMVLLKDFSPDPQTLSKRLNYRITPEEAEYSIALLERLEFLEKSTEGTYRLREPVISTTDEISSKVIRDLHAQFMQLAFDALTKLPVEKRVVQGVSIALPKNQIDSVKEKIKNLCKDISEMFAENYQNDQVFHLVINFFPLTNDGENP